MLGYMTSKKIGNRI